MNLRYLFSFIISISLFSSCQYDRIQPEITANDFIILINEIPQNDESLGFINAFVTFGSLQFRFISQNPEGALSLNEETGELSVANSTLFSLGEGEKIEAEVEVATGTQTKLIKVEITVDASANNTFIIWRGERITFSKPDGANPDLSENQDRITDNVWITRGNNGGQIYNAAVESGANKVNSPLGTEWAIGSTNEIQDLEFKPFREAVGRPQNAVGRSLVLHLIEEDIYIDITFTDWGRGRNSGGEFEYERSSP